MEHDEEYYKQKYIKYKMKFVEKLEKKNKKNREENKKNVEGGSLKNKKKKLSKKNKIIKKNTIISKTKLDKTVENKYTVPKNSHKKLILIIWMIYVY